MKANDVQTNLISMNKKTQILLSTFNGEKYLREQLDSFLLLDGYENIRVLVRDDGSHDGTVAILEEYRDRHGFELILGDNFGVNRSVFELLKFADRSCDMFALSDQDDVWLPHKINDAIQALSVYDPEIPMLFASCSQVTDADLNPLGTTIIPKRGTGFFNAMIENIAPGHTQVFNKPLLLAIIKKEPKYFHVIDFWIYLVASALGKVVFSDSGLVLHRQHTNNAVGYTTHSGVLFIRRLKRFFLSRQPNPISMQLAEFFSLYSHEIPTTYRDEIERFFFSQHHLLGRIRFVISTHVFRQKKFDTILFKVLYINKKYNIPKKVHK